MRFRIAHTLELRAAPVLVLAENEPIARHPFFALLSSKDRSYLASALRTLRLTGEYSTLFFLPSKRRLLIIGTVPKALMTHRRALFTARRVILTAKKEKLRRIEVRLDDFKTADAVTLAELAQTLAIQWSIANFEFSRYKTPPKEGWHSVEEVLVYVNDSRRVAAPLDHGRIIGEEVNAARVLSNTPGGDMTPARLAAEAVRAGRRCGFRVRVLREPAIKRLRMGGVLGVSRGSDERPRFIVMEYWGKKGVRGHAQDKPVVLAGKGVTFDTGGLNLKSEQALSDMHMDMSGGSAVIHTIAALARLKAKKNVIGLVPAVENMPSGSSYHPGDILKTMSGKTIEVLNTDAEGRVILADALTYAKRYKPRLVIDIATLTGAAVTALGQRASAIFTTDPKLEQSFREAGEKTGDFVWPLPLWEEYEEEIKGTFGDVANMGKTRYGGAITGAVFLWQFVKGMPWIHLDIAPRMTSIEGEYLAKGAAGAGIALLVEFLRKYDE